MKKVLMSILLLSINVTGSAFAENLAFNSLLSHFAPGTNLRGFKAVKEVGEGSLANLWTISGSTGCTIKFDSRNNTSYPSGRTFLVTVASGDIYSVFRAEERDLSIKETILDDGTNKYSLDNGDTLFINGNQVAIISDWSYGAKNKIFVCGGMSEME